MFKFNITLIKRRLQKFTFLTFILLICSGQIQGNAAESTLFFYNPESNINDFRSLKTLFDDYLSSKGKYQFQPFDNKQSFENFLKKNKNDVFLLSSWHYQDLLKQGYANLEAILVGTVDGKITYTKVISTKKNVKNINKLSGKNVASAGNKNYTQTMLENIAEQQDVSTEFKILSVPKDIDALMSVLFGMSQGALTARNSLETLESINPKKYSLLHQLAESQPIMLPVVVAYQPISQASTKQLVDIIENLPHSKEGKGILSILGWEGWKKVTNTEMQLLKSAQ